LDTFHDRPKAGENLNRQAAGSSAVKEDPDIGTSPARSNSVIHVATKVAVALKEEPWYWADKAETLLIRSGNGHSGMFDESVL
jgi:hypothetical protein